LAKEFSGVAHYFKVTVHDNRLTKRPSDQLQAVRIEFEIKEIEGSKLTLPGVYSIKTSDLTLSPEEIWRTYIRLTKVESTFRCLKSELGLRPIFHQKKRRIDCHLYLSMLAYQCIHKIRSLLGQKGIDDSWSTITKTLQTHIRETIYIESNTKSTLVKRITADPELSHLRIYNALNLDVKVGKTIKKIQ
jgi:transposase